MNISDGSTPPEGPKTGRTRLVRTKSFQWREGSITADLSCSVHNLVRFEVSTLSSEMEDTGKIILEKALGTSGFKRMIKELRKKVYTESDHQDLAGHLDLLTFYEEVSKLEFIDFKEIPEVDTLHEHC